MVVHRLAELASESGWEASIMTSLDFTSDGGAKLRSEAGVTVIPTQMKALFGKGRQLLDATVAAADIVHCHTMWSPLVAAATAAARRRKIPYVLSPHGMLDPYSVGQKSVRKKIYLALVERRTINGAARLMFTTKAEQGLANKAIGSLPTGEVIALGADPLPACLGTLKADFFAAHPELQGKRLLIFLGRLHEKKRPEATIKALPSIRRELPDVVLLLTGTGDTKFAAELRALAESLNLGSAVHFLGHQSGLEKWRALASSDLFLLPSRQENFAIAAAEALRAGVPTLLTQNVNIWQDIVEADAGIAIEDKDVVSSLSDAVISLLTDPERLEAMSKRAMSLAVTTYDWALCSRRTVTVYDNILRQQSPVSNA